MLKSIFKIEPKDQNAMAGDRVVLECSPPKGRPEPTVSWRKDRQKVELNSRVTIDTRGNLIFKSVEASDTGSYVCIATNPVGQKKTKAVRLKVTGMLTVLFLILILFCLINTAPIIDFKYLYNKFMNEIKMI